MIAKVTDQQFANLTEKKILIVRLPDMDKVYGKPLVLKETNDAIYMEVYRTLWDFYGFKSHLSKKYEINKVVSDDSFDNMERWLDSFYSFMYKLHKNVVEEIRKDEKVEEEAIEDISDPITNSYTKIDSKEEFKKQILEMKEPYATKYINLTEKYFTGKESSDTFLVVQLKTTKNELEITIIDYRLVLAAIEKKK